MAARMRGYVPQRQILPDMAASISASVGLGLLSRRAAADMIWPDWQQPHCTTSILSQARWILAPLSVSPIASVVVIFLPTTLVTGVIQHPTRPPSPGTAQP